MQFSLLSYFLRVSSSLPETNSIRAQTSHKRFQRESVYLLIADIAPANVQHDAIEPASEASVISQVVERKVRLKHSLLHQFQRNILIGHHSYSHTLGYILVTLDKVAESI